MMAHFGVEVHFVQDRRTLPDTEPCYACCEDLGSMQSDGEIFWRDYNS